MTPKAPKLVTESVSIDTLKPHPDNARNGDVDVIKQSLQANGQYRAIVVAKDGTVLAGNHTYAAALELGWKELDVHRLPYGPNTEQAVRVMLADNRTGDLGRYDEGLLVQLLQSVEQLEGTGYTPADLDVLQAVLDARAVDTISDADFEKLSEQDGVTLRIDGLTTTDVGLFNVLPQDTDAEKLRYLLSLHE